MGSCSGSCHPESGHLPTLSRAMSERVANHPCYSSTTSHRFARMHLAVAPACNMQCHYCNRKFDCSNESRPGVVSELLTPKQALHKALHVAAALPQLSVIGIAGPGDPLANPQKTFRTLELIKQNLPDIRLCLSTNGLALPKYVDRIADLGVDHVTITINTLDAHVAADIYEWMAYEGRSYKGLTAGQLLIDQQMEGMRKLVEKGILVKVNSVFIPRLNSQHLPELSRELQRQKVFLHNVMPLLAKPEYGTHFGLNHEPEPTTEQLTEVRQQCGQSIVQMTHCQQCRADAIGLLGEDRSQQFNLADLSDKAPDYQQVLVNRTKIQADLVSAGAAEDEDAMLVAVASTEQIAIDQHFGHAQSFLIYSVSSEGVYFVQHRRVPQYCTGDEQCDESSDVQAVLQILEDIDAVFCARIGMAPWRKLEAQHTTPVVDYAWQPIHQAIAQWWQLNKPELLARSEVS
ncbi:nitrogenase cofactor biosynthesis protein NifB [Celerinatantimonas diazotrophica]|uniref:FeMo cofactor biosynthesis protein NifB n=1 Tax=Celerinatantimonas diazotrophica TaxID=412034 RepID=A0A4R1K363_9GAMM|nr:nitrogenase cofactor biosynthesis protein NifB [Celerinatantimonas diazotrophica]TCK58505.1 nitrogen fixation protein NifB [Celerinatantimonas diazotrophica]CAG9297134.1 FeMo cofactor biosynthesis protein NifB [Celerinatantimonas diazotrophica]